MSTLAWLRWNPAGRSWTVAALAIAATLLSGATRTTWPLVVAGAAVLWTLGSGSILAAYVAASQLPLSWHPAQLLSVGPIDIEVRDTLFALLVLRVLVDAATAPLHRRVFGGPAAKVAAGALAALLWWALVVQTARLLLDPPVEAISSYVAFARSATYPALVVLAAAVAARHGRRPVVTLLAAGAAIQAAFGLWSAVVVPLTGWRSAVFLTVTGDKYARLLGTSDFQAAGTVGAPHVMAFWVAAGIVLLLSRLQRTDHPRPFLENAALCTGLVILLGALVATQVRAVMIGLVLGVIVIRLFGPRFTWPAWAAGTLGLVAVAPKIAARFGPVLLPAAQGAYRSSMGVRFDIWRQGLPLVRESWLLGLGWGQFGTALAKRWVPTANQPIPLAFAHNAYLETLVGYGAAGLLLLLTVLGALFASSVRVANGSSNPEDAALGRASAALLATATATALTGVVFFFHSSVPLWLLAGATLAREAQPRGA